MLNLVMNKLCEKESVVNFSFHDPDEIAPSETSPRPKKGYLPMKVRLQISPYVFEALDRPNKIRVLIYPDGELPT